eukprot:366490-Chlamydomonas_euryale.AAC.7
MQARCNPECISTRASRALGLKYAYHGRWRLFRDRTPYGQGERIMQGTTLVILRASAGSPASEGSSNGATSSDDSRAEPHMLGRMRSSNSWCALYKSACVPPLADHK